LADEDLAGDRRRGRVAVAGGRLDEIGFVEGHEARLVAGAKLFENGLDRGAVLGEMAVRGVDDLYEHVGARDFFEGRPEGIHELVGQLVDEAHRVGDDDRLAVAELDLARGRVESGE
jgi:hypothetical protein